MSNSKQCEPKIIMDLETLNRINARGCMACGRKFSLGETAVLAGGAWGEAQHYIHESEAACDPETGRYFERHYYKEMKNR